MDVPGVGWASSFQLGKGEKKTLRVPMSVHAASRSKVVAALHAAGVVDGVCLLQGGEDWYQYDTDMEGVFRQDSWFNYLFGVKEPNFYGALSLRAQTATLFIPRLQEEYEVWCGKIQPPGYFQELYGVDAVLYTDELEAWLAGEMDSAAVGASKVHVVKGVNSDSGLTAKPAVFPGDARLRAAGLVCEDSLFPLLAAARVTKSDAEVEAMWCVPFTPCRVAQTYTVALHQAVRLRCRPILPPASLCYITGTRRWWRATHTWRYAGVGRPAPGTAHLALTNHTRRSASSTR